MPYYFREGYKLFYQIKGDNKPPMVFIHGYLGSSESHWGAQLRDNDLNTRFRLVAPDLRGFAKSSLGKRVEKHKTEDHLHDIRALIKDELRLPRQILVGYSIGGTLALMYTLRYPEDVKAIILISPRPFMSKTTRAWNFLSKEKRSGDQKKRTASWLWKIVKRIQKLLSYTEIQIKRNRGGSKVYLNQLSEIKVPILMITGNQDTVNPSIAFEVLEKHLSHAQRINLEGDHDTAKQPEYFNKFVFEFLGKHNIS
ncbi:MAG: alpha/beta fold hydrolase [Candidatus Heimdallarchaeota archaeon]